MKILLAGASGQLGWELARQLPALGQVLAPTSAEFDLSRPDTMLRLLREWRPDVVVNAAAYTAVDRAEQEPDQAMAINAQAPGLIAEECRRLNAFLLHFSTDYVFDGAKVGPYTEQDETLPLNVYGVSKLAGEQAIQAAGARHLILRTGWLYGARGHNFVLTLRRLLASGADVPVVTDQVGTPCWTRWLAEVSAQMLQVCSSRDDVASLYHVVPAGQVSRYEQARAIRQLLDLPGQVRPVLSGQFPLPARRPANSALSCAHLEADFALTRPDWRQLLVRCLEDMAPGR